MKQKITVTREQIYDAVRSFGVGDKFGVQTLRLIRSMPMTKDLPYEYVENFPDSIEVEVDVSDNGFEALKWGNNDLIEKLKQQVNGYKLKAPALCKVGSSSHVCPSSILYESLEEARLSVGPSFYHWPATIDPATGMYKVPASKERK